MTRTEKDNSMNTITSQLAELIAAEKGMTEEAIFDFVKRITIEKLKFKRNTCIKIRKY